MASGTEFEASCKFYERNYKKHDVIPSEFGPSKHRLIDLTGLSVVRDDITTLVMKAGLILKR